MGKVPVVDFSQNILYDHFGVWPLLENERAYIILS